MNAIVADAVIRSTRASADGIVVDTTDMGNRRGASAGATRRA